MSSSEPFGPWVDAMEKARAVDPRNGRPSWNQLAIRAGVSTTAVTNMATGKTKAKASTVVAVAKALRVRPEVVSEWIGAAPVSGPWTPVEESALLSKHERKAMDDLIRAIVRGREAGDDRGDTAPINPAGGSPAPVVPLHRTDDVSEAPRRLAARDVDDDAESDAQQIDP